MVRQLRNNPKDTFDREKKNWGLDPEDEAKAYEIYDKKKKTESSNS